MHNKVIHYATSFPLQMDNQIIVVLTALNTKPKLFDDKEHQLRCE